MAEISVFSSSCSFNCLFNYLFLFGSYMVLDCEKILCVKKYYWWNCPKVFFCLFVSIVTQRLWMWLWNWSWVLVSRIVMLIESIQWTKYVFHKPLRLQKQSDLLLIKLLYCDGSFVNVVGLNICKFPMLKRTQLQFCSEGLRALY